MPRRPPFPTPFPYTTLFRSTSRFSAVKECAAPRTTINPTTRPSRHSAKAATAFSFSSSGVRSEEHTSELQSLRHLVCRLLLEKKKPSLKRHPYRSLLLSLVC